MSSFASVVLMTIFYVALNRYTNINRAPSDMDQENAQYRRMLVINYLPEVKRGGMLGYGIHFPTVQGQASIDNEYLNLALTQGYLGAGHFHAAYPVHRRPADTHHHRLDRPH